MTPVTRPQVTITAPALGALRLLRFLRLRAEHPQSISRRNRSSRKVAEPNELSMSPLLPEETGFDPKRKLVP